MDALLQFLRARLDEDEEIARAATWDEHSGVWTARPPQARHERYTVVDYLDDGVVVVTPENADTEGVGEHIARHDPARILREVTAKRGTIELHGLVYRNVTWLEGGAETTAELPVCGHCVPRHSAYRDRDDVPEGPCTTLRLLAYAYADHPDYRPRWDP